MEKEPNNDDGTDVLFFYIDGKFTVDSFGRSVMFFSRLEDITLQYIDEYVEENGYPPPHPIFPIYRLDNDK